MYESKVELLDVLEFGSKKHWYWGQKAQVKVHYCRCLLNMRYETGMLEAQHGKDSADSSFEVPKLFRFGLGRVLRGRP